MYFLPIQVFYPENGGKARCEESFLSPGASRLFPQRVWWECQPAACPTKGGSKCPAWQFLAVFLMEHSYLEYRNLTHALLA